MPAAEFKAAVRACRAELRARGFKLMTSGGYRLEPLAVQARLTTPRWYTGDTPHDWGLYFGGPGSTWDRGFEVEVFTYYQGHQYPTGDYYAVDTAERVEQFLDDFRRKTLQTIDRATSPEALIDLLLRREIAPMAGFGKGSRKNQVAFAHSIFRIATAYGIREAYVGAVTDLLRPELEESPQRRSAAQEFAEREGLLLT